MSFHIVAKFVLIYAEMLQLLGTLSPKPPTKLCPEPDWGHVTCTVM